MAKRIAAVLTVASALVLPAAIIGCKLVGDGSPEYQAGGPSAGGYNQAPGGARWPQGGWTAGNNRQRMDGAAPGDSALYPHMPVYGQDNQPFSGGSSGALDGDWMRGEKYPEMDPANPLQKGQMGVHVSPRSSIENQYNPNTLSRRIHGAGLISGLTQHSFAPAGGDHNASLDPTGRILYFSTTRQSKNPKLAMKGVDSKSWTLLTDDTMADMMPSVSPDGKWLAWCSNRYGNWQLLLRPLDAPSGSSPKQLTQSPDDDIHPSWSPDSKFMAFSRFNSMDGQWQIWVYDTHRKTFSAVAEGLFPNFCPIVKRKNAEGRPVYTIAYQRHRQRDVPWFSIWTMDLVEMASGRIEALGSPTEIVSSNDWAAITPAWSPNGEYLAFASVRKSPLSEMQARIYRADDIWAVKLDGTDLTQITDHPAPDWYPHWAPEEGNPVGRIYFTSSRGGNPTIWSVPPLLPGMLFDLQVKAEQEVRAAGVNSR